MAKQESTLKDFYGRKIGYIVTDTVSGDKVGYDFYHRICGYYDKKLDVTKDFYRRIIGRGDMLASLIASAK